MILLRISAARLQALVVLLALVAASPLAAQLSSPTDQQSLPLDIVPLSPVEVEPIAEEPVIPVEIVEPLEAAPDDTVTGDTVTEEAITGDAVTGEAITGDAVQAASQAEAIDANVEVGSIQAPDPEAIGLMEEAEGGFPYDMWRGSDRALIERMLPRLPAGGTSRAMNDLARRLLLSTAAPPAGPAKENLLAIRIERLAAMGDSVSMNHLMRSVPPDLYDSALLQTRLDSLLLIADYVGACSLARELVRRDDTPYWEKVLIFCQALNERHDAAALGLSLLRERSVEQDLGFETLLRALAGDGSAKLDSLPAPTALHLSMVRAARLSVPEDAGEGAEPAIARAIALTAGVPLDFRLRAAERAEALGTLDTETLAELYVSVPFTSEELAYPWRRLKTDKGPMARALLHQAIAIQVVPAARAEVLRAAWQLGGESGGWDGYATAARVTLSELIGLNPLPELVWIAGDAIRALLAAGRPDMVTGWLDLAASQAGANAKAAAAVAALSPIIGLADDEDATPWDDARFAAWRQSQNGATEGMRRLRTAMLFGLMSALDRKTPPQALLTQLDGPETVWVKTPPPAFMRQLDLAADEGRIGETVLLALVALDSANSGAPSPMTLSAAVSALQRIGLGAEARAIAIEAVLSREF